MNQKIKKRKINVMKKRRRRRRKRSSVQWIKEPFQKKKQNPNWLRKATWKYFVNNVEGPKINPKNNK